MVESDPMRVIDTRTGRELDVGSRVAGGLILGFRDRFFSATAIVGIERPGGLEMERVPLIVRFTHPSFFLRRVAFYPS